MLLVGVDHRIQWVPETLGAEWQHDLLQFAEYLEGEAKLADVDLIAEESSEESLRRSQARASIARDVTSSLKVRHLFCDPDSERRSTLSTETVEQREQYWFDAISRGHPMVTLFVCGDSHVDSFEQRCRAAGFDAHVLSRGWGEGWQLRA